MRRPAARRPRRVPAAVLIVLGAATACADDGPGVAGPTAVAVAARPCDRPLPSEGVGVVIGDGLVVTAAHVVDGPRRDVLVDGRPGSVVAVEARTDVALVAADVGGSTVRFEEPSGRDALVLTPSGEVPAEIVRTGTLAVDDLSANRRHEREAHTFRPGVSGGSSGAPLVDDAGGLLGIVVLDNPTDGTAYAVTSAEVHRFVDAARTADRHAPAACPG